MRIVMIMRRIITQLWDNERTPIRKVGAIKNHPCVPALGHSRACKVARARGVQPS